MFLEARCVTRFRTVAGLKGPPEFHVRFSLVRVRRSGCGFYVAGESVGRDFQTDFLVDELIPEIRDFECAFADLRKRGWKLCLFLLVFARYWSCAELAP